MSKRKAKGFKGKKAAPFRKGGKPRKDEERDFPLHRATLPGARSAFSDHTLTRSGNQGVGIGFRLCYAVGLTGIDQ